MESNVPATPQEKLEALKFQAEKKGRKFNEKAVKASLGIVDEVAAPVVEEAKKPSKAAKKAVKKASKAQPKISKGKIGKKK